MFYVLRDAQGQIISLHRESVPGGQTVDKAHPDVVAFLGQDPDRQRFASLDADLVRVLDNQGSLWVWGGSNGNSHGQMGVGDDRELAFLSGFDGTGGAWHFNAQRVGKGYRSIACSKTRAAAIAKRAHHEDPGFFIIFC